MIEGVDKVEIEGGKGAVSGEELAQEGNEGPNEALAPYRLA